MRKVETGNGRQWHGGVRTLEELLKIAPDMYDITVFGAEPHPNYNRILLSPVLARRNEPAGHHPQRPPVVHRQRHRTVVEQGDEDRPQGRVVRRGWQRARIRPAAAGHRFDPFILPVPGKDLPGRDRLPRHADTDAMIDAAAKHKHAVVIGAGLLGLGAANGLALRGMDVTVVHIGDWIMERQLDPRGRHAAEVAREEGPQVPAAKFTAELIAGESGAWSRGQFKDGDRSPPTWW